MFFSVAYGMLHLKGFPAVIEDEKITFSKVLLNELGSIFSEFKLMKVVL